MKLQSENRLWRCGLLCVSLIISTEMLASGAEIQGRETEAARLESLRSLIRQEPSGKLSVFSNPKLPPPNCAQMLQGLLSGNAFAPIEPTEVVDEVEDSGGPWRYCGNAEADGDEVRAAKLFKSFSVETGGAPFRIYKLPKAIDPHPEADLFFLTQTQSSSYRGQRSGRTVNWVNLANCEYVERVGNFSEWQYEANPGGHQAALTKYGNSFVVWSVAQRFGYRAIYLNPRGAKKLEADHSSAQVCSWSTVAENPSRN